MSQDNELRRLEQFVERLLVRFSELRTEKARLQQELHEREMQVEDLRNTLSSKEMERSEISQRVNKIVAQIEEWESGFAEAAVVEAEALPEENGDEVYDDDPVSEKPAVEGSRAEDEGRGQKNLFSLGGMHRQG